MIDYNDAIVTFCGLDVEFILQQKSGRGHWVSKAEENLEMKTHDNEINDKNGNSLQLPHQVTKIFWERKQPHKKLNAFYHNKENLAWNRFFFIQFNTMLSKEENHVPSAFPPLHTMLLA